MFASSWLAATSQAVPPPPPLLGSGGSENANCLWAKPTEGLILGYSDILDMFPVPVSGNDWVSDCRLACEDSALHTFVNGKHAFTPEEVRLFRDSASERYCEGIVLVEMPYNCEGDTFARRVGTHRPTPSPFTIERLSRGATRIFQLVRNTQQLYTGQMSASQTMTSSPTKSTALAKECRTSVVPR